MRQYPAWSSCSTRTSSYLNHGELRRLPGACLRGATSASSASSSAIPSEFLGRRFHELTGEARTVSGGVRRRAGGRSCLRAERDRGAERGDPVAGPRPGRRGADDAARVRRGRAHLGSSPARSSCTRSRRSSPARSGRGRGRCRSATSPRRPRSCSRSRRSALPRARQACSRSSTARTPPANCRSTSGGSAPTSTPATATSGSRRRRARGSSGHGPSTSAGSSRSSSRGAGATDASFAERHGWQGTRDPAAALAVPAAIEAHRSFDLERCRRLAASFHDRLPPVGGAPAPQMWTTEVAVDDPDRAAAPPLRRAPDRGRRARVGGPEPAARLDRPVQRGRRRRALARRTCRVHCTPQAPVAQGIERAPPEREVGGSNPPGRMLFRRMPRHLRKQMPSRANP